MAAGSYWEREASLVAHTCQVAEGTPPVPAITGLVLLAAIAGLWPRLRHSERWRRDSLLIYILLAIGVPLSAANVWRQLLPAVTSLSYFARPENDFLEFARYLPSWLVPTDPEVLRTFYEGLEGRPLPWVAWVPTLVTWCSFFAVYSLSLLCLVSIFRRPWAEHERLTFPLVDLAVQLAPEGRGEKASGVTSLIEGWLLRQPLFWAGFAAAAVFNITNVLHAFSPQVAAMGLGYDFGALFTQRPWNGLRPMYFAFRPEMVGLGYLVPTDVLFSTWVFYLVLRVENFVAQLMGYDIAGFPFEWPQGTGSYAAIAVFTVYAARRHLAAVIRSALGLGPRLSHEEEEALPYRLAFWGFVLGFVAMVGFCRAAGLSLQMGLAYVTLSFMAALIYSRVRAQTGVPISYCLPRRDVYWLVFDLWPSPGSLSGPRLKEEVVFGLLTVINRMTFPQVAALELESIRIGDRLRLGRNVVLVVILLALCVGWALGGWTHLTAYYSYGANVMDGGTTEGGWRTRQARMQWERLQTRYTSPVPINWRQTGARIAGFSVTGALILLRSKFLRFPLHPLGLALASTFGYHTWFPLFVAWMLKTIILRLGGPRLYRRAMAPFLGLAIGHFLLAGAAWGLFGAFNEEAAKRYLVWFA